MKRELLCLVIGLLCGSMTLNLTMMIMAMLLPVVKIININFDML